MCAVLLQDRISLTSDAHIHPLWNFSSNALNFDVESWQINLKHNILKHFPVAQDISIGAALHGILGKRHKFHPSFFGLLLVIVNVAF